MTTRTFPDGFRWGTATAAHQVEGGNWNSDWWRWEHTPGSPCKEPSGDACDQYHRYADDLALLAGLGFDSYRFSIEWARIEPDEGEFSKAALDHYKRVCSACIAAGLEPVVTFHHFTSPRWVADAGGWESPDTADRFARYCGTAAGHLAALIGTACTINEPNVVGFCGHRLGVFPPGKTDKEAYRRATETLATAHRRAVDAIKSARADLPVGLTLSMSDYQAVDGAEAERDRVRAHMEDVYLDACHGDDFFGVQTYTRTRVGADGVTGPEAGVAVLPMGYEYWPDALEATLRRAWEYLEGEVPLLVTENGIGTEDDEQRVAYVTAALEGVLRCLDDDIDVRGYTYWSAFDNFEWIFGYGPKFGIVAVDRETQERMPKPSSSWLGAIAKANSLSG
ncbi:MAG: glycoside hydrolase family 1 protein [Acidimicrobiales bacterium]